MANGDGGSITPFFSIWTQPRATIRSIVDTDPTRNIIALAATGPAISGLASQWSKALNSGTGMSVLWPLWVAVTVALSAAAGVLSLYIVGALFKWSGSLLGGVASRVQVRAAIAWAQVPAIAAEIALLAAVLMGVPIPAPHAAGTLPQIDPSFYKVMAVEGVLGIWGFVVSLKCIAEVHRFSAWRALVAVLIPPFIVVSVIGFIVFVISRVAGHH